MAGIMANSVTATMGAGDTAVDNSASGYLTKETIGLTVTGTPGTVRWSLSKPSSSGSICRLSDDDKASVQFTPDVPDYYVITCLVDGTTLYVLRIGVAEVSPTTSLTAIRLIPVANATVPAPAVGATIFYSLDSDTVAKKLPNGTVSAL